MILLKILDYIPSNAEIGVGLALRLRMDEYIFFLPGARHINSSCLNELFYAGVGGHLEEGENFLECGRREAYEEIGLSIDYESSHNTVYIDFNKKIRTIEVEENIKPLAIFEMIHPKGSPREGRIYHIVIFKALLEIEPHYFQHDEVSGVIIMNKDQVRKGNRRATIQQLINEGARIIGPRINNDTILYPIGTAEALTYISEGI